MMFVSTLVIVLAHLNLILADDILVSPSVTAYGKQWQGDLPKGVFGHALAPVPRQLWQHMPTKQCERSVSTPRTEEPEPFFCAVEL